MVRCPPELPEEVVDWLAGKPLWVIALYAVAVHYGRSGGNVSQSSKTLDLDRVTVRAHLRRIKEAWGLDVRRVMPGAKARRPRVFFRTKYLHYLLNGDRDKASRWEDEDKKRRGRRR